jgi:hypothetical protein
MDEADLAQQEVELSLKLSLQRKEPSLAATGTCYFCSETLPEGQKFCDSDCEEDYRRLQWQKSQRVRG